MAELASGLRDEQSAVARERENEARRRAEARVGELGAELRAHIDTELGRSLRAARTEVRRARCRCRRARPHRGPRRSGGGDRPRGREGRGDGCRGGGGGRGCRRGATRRPRRGGRRASGRGRSREPRGERGRGGAGRRRRRGAGDERRASARLDGVRGPADGGDPRGDLAAQLPEPCASRRGCGECTARAGPRGAGAASRRAHRRARGGGRAAPGAARCRARPRRERSGRAARVARPSAQRRGAPPRRAPRRQTPSPPSSSAAGPDSRHGSRRSWQPARSRPRRGSPRRSPTAERRLAAVADSQAREERVRERTAAAEQEASERVREAEQRLVEVLAQDRRRRAPRRLGDRRRRLPQNAEIVPAGPVRAAVGIHPPCHDGPVSTTAAQQAAHLHVHSEYSLLDGANKIDAMAARAAELGMPALGLTDHGVMNGSVELFKACGAARDQADHGPRGLPRRRRRGDQAEDEVGAQPPDAAGRRTRPASRTSSSSARPASSRASRAARRTSTRGCSSATRRA